MADCLLAMRQHRHNHKVSEKRRLDFPILGHYNTWIVDAIQSLVYKNHRIHLYTGWTNANDYGDTAESFGSVAVHSPALQKAIDNRWNEMKQTSVKLSDDEKHICESMGVPLPPLPFKSKEENIQFAKCALDDDFPFKDDEQAAIQWCNYVDGVTIHAKLPFHMRHQREEFEKNQRVRNMMRKSLKGREALSKLNSVIKPPRTSQPEARIDMPAALPLVSVNAREESAAPVGGVCTGDLPKSEAVDRSRGRGPDKNPGSRPRNTCTRCKEWCPEHMFICKGKGGADKCDLFDDDRKRRCGRCKRAHDLEKVEEGQPKTKGLHLYSCLGATCPIVNLNQETCEYYDKKYRPRWRRTTDNL